MVWGPQAEGTAPPVPAPTPLLGQPVPTAGACVISSLCFVKFASSGHHVAGPAGAAAPSCTPRPHCNGALVLMSPSPRPCCLCLAFPAPDRQQSPRQGMVLPWGSRGCIWGPAGTNPGTNPLRVGEWGGDLGGMCTGLGVAHKPAGGLSSTPRWFCAPDPASAAWRWALGSCPWLLGSCPWALGSRPWLLGSPLPGVLRGHLGTERSAATPGRGARGWGLGFWFFGGVLELSREQAAQFGVPQSGCWHEGRSPLARGLGGWGQWRVPAAPALWEEGACGPKLGVGGGNAAGLGRFEADLGM